MKPGDKVTWITWARKGYESKIKEVAHTGTIVTTNEIPNFAQVQTKGGNVIWLRISRLTAVTPEEAE